MLGRRETNHRPKFFLPPPPHPLHRLFLPLTVPHKKKRHELTAATVRNQPVFKAFSWGAGRLGGSRKGVGGAGAEGKTAWGLMGFPPPPLHCIYFRILFAAPKKCSQAISIDIPDALAPTRQLVESHTRNEKTTANHDIIPHELWSRI